MPSKPPQKNQRPRSEMNVRQALYSLKESFRYMTIALLDAVGVVLSPTGTGSAPGTLPTTNALMESFRHSGIALLHFGILSRNQWTTINGIISNTLVETGPAEMPAEPAPKPGVVQQLRRAV